MSLLLFTLYVTVSLIAARYILEEDFNMNDSIILICFAPFFMLSAWLILAFHSRPFTEDQLRNLHKVLDDKKFKR